MPPAKTMDLTGRSGSVDGFNGTQPTSSYVPFTLAQATAMARMRRFPKGTRHFLLACVPPLVMSLMLSRWFLLLLLLPMIAATMAALLHWRSEHGKCLRCGAAFDPTLLKCPTCRRECSVGLNLGLSRKSPSPAPIANQAAPDQPVEWPAGVELEAIVPTIVQLPGSILGNDEVFDSVIQQSGSNAKISFEPGGTDGAIFRSISVRLEPGDRLKLTKTTKAILVNEGGAPGEEFYMRDVTPR